MRPCSWSSSRIRRRLSRTSFPAAWRSARRSPARWSTIRICCCSTSRFGKLDSLTRLSMQNELLALWRKVGFTALLVTHDVEEALLLADRVIVLSPSGRRASSPRSTSSSRIRAGATTPISSRLRQNAARKRWGSSHDVWDRPVDGAAGRSAPRALLAGRSAGGG